MQQRKVISTLIKFVKGSQTYYRRLIHTLTKNLKFVDRLQLDDASPYGHSFRDNLNTAPQSLLKRCSGSLIRLGDLSRWREEARGGSKNWVPSTNFYLLAQSLNPQDGTSMFKQSIISWAKGDVLTSIYQLYLSMMTELPCEQSWNHLTTQLRSPSPPLLTKPVKEADSIPRHDLIQSFLNTQLGCFRDQGSKDAEEMFFANLESVLDHSVYLDDVAKMLLSGLAAEYIIQASLRRDTVEIVDLSMTLPHLIAAMCWNARFFSTLLRKAREQLANRAPPDIAMGSWQQPAPCQLSNGLIKILPLLRQSSGWFCSRASLFAHEMEDGHFNQVAKQMLEQYRLLIVQLRCFPIFLKMPSNPYLMAEDAACLQFRPLNDMTNPRLRARFYSTDGCKTGLKRPYSEAQSQGRPDVSLCMISDILEDWDYIRKLDVSVILRARWMLLTQKQESPLDMDGAAMALTSVTADTTHISETCISLPSDSAQLPPNSSPSLGTHVSETKLTKALKDHQDSKSRVSSSASRAFLEKAAEDRASGSMSPHDKHNMVDEAKLVSRKVNGDLLQHRRDTSNGTLSEVALRLSSSYADIPDPTCTAPAIDPKKPSFKPHGLSRQPDELFVRSSALFDDHSQNLSTPPAGQR